MNAHGTLYFDRMGLPLLLMIAGVVIYDKCLSEGWIFQTLCKKVVRLKPDQPDVDYGPVLVLVPVADLSLNEGGLTLG